MNDYVATMRQRVGFAVAFVVRRWQGTPRADGIEGSSLRFFSLSELPHELTSLHKATIEDYKDYCGNFLLR